MISGRRFGRPFGVALAALTLTDGPVIGDSPRAGRCRIMGARRGFFMGFDSVQGSVTPGFDTRRFRKSVFSAELRPVKSDHETVALGLGPVGGRPRNRYCLWRRPPGRSAAFAILRAAYPLPACSNRVLRRFS